MPQALGLDQHDNAIGLVQQAKELLHTLESEVSGWGVLTWQNWFHPLALTQVGYLAMLCYNFGLDVFQKGHFQHSATWLK